MISKNQFSTNAKALNVEVAPIKTVAEVECRGDGFLADSKQKILFKPHIFWKQLRQKRINPNLFMEENPEYKGQVTAWIKKLVCNNASFLQRNKLYE